LGLGLGSESEMNFVSDGAGDLALQRERIFVVCADGPSSRAGTLRLRWSRPLRVDH
jgi:hypothetical protein